MITNEKQAEAFRRRRSGPPVLPFLLNVRSAATPLHTGTCPKDYTTLRIG